MVLLQAESNATVEKMKENKAPTLNIFNILTQAPFEDEE